MQIIFLPGTKYLCLPHFVNKFLDSNGFLNDAEGYHRSLAIAMNPEKFAQFFYEQGKSEATEDVIRKTKNINI